MNTPVDAWLTGPGPEAAKAIILLVAFIVGVAIGIERGIRTRSIGSRTCTLVELASAGFATPVITRVPESSSGRALAPWPS